jgi:hypothetical protein
MICLVKTDRGNNNGVVLRCGGSEVFAVEQRVSEGTLTLQRSSQCMKWGWMYKKCGKMNRTLRVTRSHAYIEEGGANCFRENRRFIRRPLEATRTTQDARRRASVRWCALMPTCTFMRCALVWWTFGPRVITGLSFRPTRTIYIQTRVNMFVISKPRMFKNQNVFFIG